MIQRHRKLLGKLRTRQGRRKSGYFLAEGLRCCLEALAHQSDNLELTVLSASAADLPEGRELLALAADAGSLVEVLPDGSFADVAVTENPQGFLCVLQRPTDPVPTCSGPFILILDRVSEPGNLGTVLRTAQAVGLREVWLVRGTTDPYGPKAIRAGMGAQFRLCFPVFDSLRSAASVATELGIAPVWCAVPRGGVSCFSDAFQLRGAALVIGNEAEGIGDLSVGPGVTIPMPGAAESLNAAQAATVLLVEAVRRGWVVSEGDAVT